MALSRMLLIAALAVALPTIAPAQRRVATPEERQTAEAAVARHTRPTLTRFGSEQEFRAYVEAIRAAARTRGRWWVDSGRIQFAQVQPDGAQSDIPDHMCSPEDAECAASEFIVVTGSRIAAPSNPSITNNQMRGVEEGDIVKQINQFLLILQDGRIFVVDTRSRGRRLALTDRVNVYRDSRSEVWYDEMLVFGDRVLITGYGYGEEATELSVFRLDDAGRLSREGVFLISSNDYYDTGNYATRLIGDTLVIYTPFAVLDMAQPRFTWPLVRRWVPYQARDEAAQAGRPLFDAATIYRPVRDLFAPTVHTVSVCPLGGGNLDCRTTAFVGPSRAEWYVTNTDAFIWTVPDWDEPPHVEQDCASNEPFPDAGVVLALVYRIPVSGAAPTMVGARGAPIDQFSFLAGERRFRALLKREQRRCREEWDAPVRLSYLDIPLDSFLNQLAEIEDDRYTPLPATGTRWIANRFTDRYLVYGGLSGYRRGLPTFNNNQYRNDPYWQRRIREALAMPPAYAVPVDRPAGVVRLDLGQTVIRAEQAGNDIIVTGYSDRRGLRVTLIDLDRRPRVASSILLDGRFESEGRSHAFNSRIAADGSGLMGLPTVPRISESSRSWWRSRASDLSFLDIDREGRLAAAGELERRLAYSDDDYDEDGIPGYTCEVSCIDWYGNSRPIFTDGRIFALAGAELIEGRMEGGRIREVQRLNIALTPPPR